MFNVTLIERGGETELGQYPTMQEAIRETLEVWLEDDGSDWLVQVEGEQESCQMIPHNIVEGETGTAFIISDDGDIERYDVAYVETDDGDTEVELTYIPYTPMELAARL